MSEPNNGKNGLPGTVVNAMMENLQAYEVPPVGKIFITFDVVLNHGNSVHHRSFSTWLPSSKIQRVFGPPTPFLGRG